MTINISIPNYSLAIGGKTILDKSHLTVAPNKKYGLMGKNGIGKSTLLKDITRLRGLEGDCYLVSQDILVTDQSIYDQILSTHNKLWSLKTKISRMEETDEIDGLDELYEQWSMNDFDRVEKELYRILHGLGFTNEDCERPVNSFSGGWRMRISLASALFIKPSLLLLDEPTNHLDLNGVVWLMNYLEKETTFTLIVVSHDIEFLNTVCTDIMFMEKINDTCTLRYYSGNYTKFIKAYQIEITKRDKDWHHYQSSLKSYRKKNSHNKNKIEQFIKENYKERPPQIKPPRINIPDMTPISGSYLTLDEVSFGYDNEHLFKDICLGLAAGTRYTIVGKNGSGKSTLLKIIAGKLTPTGTVWRNQQLRIGYYHQHTEDILPYKDTPIEYLESLNHRNVRPYLGQIGLPGKEHTRAIKNLSGGQKARVALIGTLLQKPHILLLDEPTNHLDLETNEVLIEELKNFTGAIITVTHDINLINELDSVLLHLTDEGTLIETSYDEYTDYVLSQDA